MRTLPPFPLDDQMLSLLETAINPWAHGVQAECSSLGSFLEFVSQMAGADPNATEETELDDGVAILRDPQYAAPDVIQALIDEVRRLRRLRAGAV